MGQICATLCNFGQIYATLSDFEWIFANLLYFEQICTTLCNFELICATLRNFEQKYIWHYVILNRSVQLCTILNKSIWHKYDPLYPVENLQNYIWIEILPKKVRRRMCDPLGLVDRPDFHTYILIEILLKKVRHEKCDPWVYMNWNFAQKSATWKVWPLVLYELKFCSKKCNMKCVTLGFIWTEILLKKVRHEMCDPWFYMNRNFAQKSATWKVRPMVLE